MDPEVPKKRKESKYHGKKNPDKYKPKNPDKPKKPKKPKKKRDPNAPIIKNKKVNVYEYKCYHQDCQETFTKWKMAREHIEAHGVKKPNINKSRTVVDQKTIRITKTPPAPKDKTKRRVVVEYLCYFDGCGLSFKKWGDAREHMLVEHDIKKTNIKKSRVTEMVDRAEIQRRHEEHIESQRNKKKKKNTKSDTDKLRETLKAFVTTLGEKSPRGSLLKAVLDSNNTNDKVQRRYSF